MLNATPGNSVISALGPRADALALKLGEMPWDPAFGGEKTPAAIIARNAILGGLSYNTEGLPPDQVAAMNKLVETVRDHQTRAGLEFENAPLATSGIGSGMSFSRSLSQSAPSFNMGNPV